MGLVAVATQILEMTWTRTTLKASSPSVSHLMMLRTDEGSKPLLSSSEAVCLTHTLHSATYYSLNLSYENRREARNQQCKARKKLIKSKWGNGSVPSSCLKFMKLSAHAHPSNGIQSHSETCFPLVMGFKCFYPPLKEPRGKCVWEIAL